jgi:hypothetical protein
MKIIKRRKHMKKLFITVAFIMLATSSFAAEPAPDKKPSPEEMKQIMEMSLGAMVPMMGKMTEVMIEAQLIVAEKPETAARIAVFKKNVYEALIKQGFSKKEAFEIMMNTAVPAAMPGMK